MDEVEFVNGVYSYLSWLTAWPGRCSQTIFCTFQGYLEYRG
jgi:hypothetical protein